MNTQAAIAQHLNLAEELIIEVQEWAKVLWVRIKGMRPRFVSKKGLGMEKTVSGLAQALLEIGFTKAKVVQNKDWKQHFLQPQPQTIQDSWNAYHQDRKSKEWCYGAADEESF